MSSMPPVSGNNRDPSVQPLELMDNAQNMIGQPFRVTVGPDETLTQIAGRIGMTLEEFIGLQPQFDIGKVDGTVDPTRNGNGGWDPDFVRAGDVFLLNGGGSSSPDGTSGTEGASGSEGAGSTAASSGNEGTQSTGSSTSTSGVDGAQNVPAQGSNSPLDLNDVYNRYKGGDYVMGAGRTPGTDENGYSYGAPGEKTSDCSAFVSAVWAEKGLKLPAFTDDAYNYLKSIGAQTTTSDPQPGDVVFWMGEGANGSISHHMGIYMGDGKVLQQTSANGGGVQVLDMPKSDIEILRDPRMQSAQ